jgi:hypothetical protein
LFLLTIERNSNVKQRAGFNPMRYGVTQAPEETVVNHTNYFEPVHWRASSAKKTVPSAGKAIRAAQQRWNAISERVGNRCDLRLDFKLRLLATNAIELGELDPPGKVDPTLPPLRHEL